MNKKLLLIAIALVAVLGGCADGGDNGDVERAKQASTTIPKDASQLPDDMPPQARASAAAAIAQQQAMQQQESRQQQQKR